MSARTCCTAFQLLLECSVDSKPLISHVILLAIKMCQRPLGNRISEIPNSISNCAQLLNLYASDNNIVSISPITELTELETLFLCGNRIKRLPPSFRELKHLKSLYLARNSFDFFPLETVLLRRLTILDLSVNRIKDVPSEISSLTFLREMNLAYNQISCLPDMTNLTCLSNLYVNDNLLSSLDGLPLSGNCSIRIDGNQIEEVSEELQWIIPLLDYVDPSLPPQNYRIRLLLVFLK